MLKKFWRSLRSLLIAIDQLLYVVFAIPVYLCGGLNDAPNPDETISSITGKAHKRGELWAIPAMFIVDTIFYVPEGRYGHCYRCIEDDE